jgi:hypothetical protein
MSPRPTKRYSRGAHPFLKTFPFFEGKHFWVLFIDAWRKIGVHYALDEGAVERNGRGYWACMRCGNPRMLDGRCAC